MKTNQKIAITPESASALVAMGAHLRESRLAQRLTHDQIAPLAGVSRQTLSRIERGDPSVAIGQVLRYAGLVGASALFTPPHAPAEGASRRRVRRTRDELEASQA